MGGREGKGKVKRKGGREGKMEGRKREGKREGREGEGPPPTAFWTNRTLTVAHFGYNSKSKTAGAYLEGTKSAPLNSRLCAWASLRTARGSHDTS